MHRDRRTFLITAIGSASALAASRVAFSTQAATPLVESDAQAQTLGYKADAVKADRVKFPKYAPGQMCGNCQLYQGKPADSVGPCPLFQNRLVAAKGWCSAWVKKT